jgi:uncharacterized protein YbaR (Trm112 family)
MKKDFVTILCCPVSVCMGNLELREIKAEKDDIIEGTLRCVKCNRVYPIRDGTANLVPEGVPPDKVLPIRIFTESDDKDR